MRLHGKVLLSLPFRFAVSCSFHPSRPRPRSSVGSGRTSLSIDDGTRFKRVRARPSCGQTLRSGRLTAARQAQIATPPLWVLKGSNIPSATQCVCLHVQPSCLHFPPHTPLSDAFRSQLGTGTKCGPLMFLFQPAELEEIQLYEEVSHKIE